LGLDGQLQLQLLLLLLSLLALFFPREKESNQHLCLYTSFLGAGWGKSWEAKL